MKKLMGWFFKSLSLVITLLPLKVQLCLGKTLGFIWFDVLRIRRKVAIDNIGIAFPKLSLAERTSMARSSLAHMGHTLIEFAQFPFFKDEDISRFFDFEGEENIHEAIAQKRGVLLLSLHLGNGDFAVAALSRRGLPIQLISKEFKLRWLNDLWFGMRKRHGTHFISPEKSSFDILRALKRNEFVVFVLDQFMGPPIGVRTKFFGHEAGTAAGLALMALRTRAPVVPCYTFRNGDGRCTVVFEPQIPLKVEGLTEQNIAVMTQVYTDKIEEIVRRHPEQWMWIHRRWKPFRD
jgi:KDO2-lipid IV(A) lauroyltransferase